MTLVGEDIVISGVGGYFPKAQNIEEFQKRLLSNDNLITSRWTEGLDGVTNAIGAIESGNFDHGYFRILRQQCPYLDPMYTLAYERTYEALLDAGVNPVELKGKNIGCFMGSCIGESDNILCEISTSGYGITGHSRTMLPSRISYWLDLKGPTFNLFYNWMSGLEVLRVAVDSVKNGHCDAAIVGATNLTVNSGLQRVFHHMNFLSPDGTQKSFDEDANGIVRGDAVVVLYIQRASDAKRSYASILKVDSIFDGNHSEPFIDVNLNNFTSFMENFYKDTHVKPSEVDYVEAYGCGIKKIDEKEVEGLEKVYCKNRTSPLLIGTVKPNTGHSEATSALVSLVKVLISMEKETIPATINYHKANSNISALNNGKVEVVRQNRKWGGQYAAVNCFGMTSAYGHILLKSNSKRKMLSNDNIPRLILSASRTEIGIDNMLQTIEGRSSDIEYINLIQEFHSKPTPLHTCRGYMIRGDDGFKKETQIYQGNKCQVWFVYSGMGSQWNGMVGDLMKIPVFAESINKSHNTLLSKDVNLKEIITTKDPTNFDNILNCFLGIAAIQIALTDVLKCLNIVPDGIIGHSVGELGCAYADGCLTAEEMILASYYRGRASLEATLIKGMMAAVGIGYNKIKNMLPPNIEVACHNSAESCTISGPKEDMEVFVKKLQNDGIFARLVNVANIAYHSQYIKPAAPILLKYLKQVLTKPVERSSKWISTSNSESQWNTDLAKYSSAEYHTNNLLSSVLFEEGFKHVPKDAILIEIAPHGLLQAILKRSCKQGCINVPLTQRGIAKNVEYLLSAVGRLYLSGLTIDLPKLYPSISYPVGKGTTCLANLAHWDHTFWDNVYAEKSSIAAVADYVGNVNTAEFLKCRHHQIHNKTVIPTSSFLKLVFDVISKIKLNIEAIVFEDLTFVEPVVISEFSSIPIHIMVQRGSGHFEIVVNNDVLVSGKLYFPITGEDFLLEQEKQQSENYSVQLSHEDIFKEFNHRGHFYSEQYITISKISINEQNSQSVIEWNNDWSSFIEAMIQQKLLHDGEKNQKAYVPHRINRLAIDFKLLPSEPTKITTKHNYGSNIISTPGINLIGMHTVVLPNRSTNITVESLEFIPFKGHTFENTETGLFYLFQTFLNNYTNQNLNKVDVIGINTKNETLFKKIEQVTKFFKNFQFNFQTNQKLDSIEFKANVPQLVMYSSNINNALAEIITSTNAYFLLRSSENIKNYRNIVEVLQITIDNTNYSLIRKQTTPLPIILNLKDTKLSVEDLDGKANWLTDLENSLGLAKKQHAKIYLLSNAIPVEGIETFAHKIFSFQRMDPVRLIFALHSDKTDALLAEVFKSDRKLNVIKNNICGSIILMPLALKNKVVDYEMRNTDVNVDYIGLNNDASILKNCNKGNLISVDYAGHKKNGQNVMGVGQFNKITSEIVVDPILQWDLPKTIPLENAATIPMAYACAYYCLVIKGKITKSSRVLIHSAASPIGMAALAIASAYECVIYATVETEQQKLLLLSKYEGLHRNCIFNSRDHNFQPLVSQATLGKQIDVVLNTLSGSFVQTSLYCLHEHGIVIHIGETGSDFSVGMFMFERDNSLSVFNPNNLYKLSNEVKKYIRDLLYAGINDCTIRFSRYAISDNINIEKIMAQDSQVAISHLIQLHKNKLLNKSFDNDANIFICRNDMSYLILADETEEWCDLTEWFVYRKAKNLSVTLKSKPTDNYIIRRLNLLQANYDVNITFNLVKNGTENELKDTVFNTHKSAPIDVICVMPENVKHLNNLKNILTKTSLQTKLLVLNSSNICIPDTLNIAWEKGLKNTEYLKCLDNVLSYKLPNCVLRSNITSEQLSKISNAKKIHLLLPNLDDMLEEYLDGDDVKPKLIQLTSASRKEVRDLPPVFIIPGLGTRNKIESLCIQLLYPTWMVVLPKTVLPLNKMAKLIAQEIIKVNPNNVYNLVGVSWGGPLLMEVAHILNKESSKLHLYLIDSAPDSVKSIVNHLGEGEQEIEVNFLSKLFNIEKHEDKIALVDAQTWNDKLNILLKRVSKAQFNLYRNAISNVKYLLDEVKNYTLDGKLIKGKVHLIRPDDSGEFDNCGLLSYCEQVPKIQLIAGDHQSVICHKNTAQYIAINHQID